MTAPFADLAFGRLPEDRRQPKLRLGKLLGAPPTPPPAADWLSAVPRYGMYANDQVGCCTAVGAAHTAIAIDKYGQERDLHLTDDDVLTMYKAVSGWDGVVGSSSDVGATLQDALNYWRREGIKGNKVAAFAWIDPDDLNLIRACIATFGSIYIGFLVTSAAMTQFNRGQDWTTTASSRLLGGHCVRIGAYDANSFTCTTWGRVQKMSINFFLRWVDEITVPIDLDWMRANGTSPAGLDVARLNADYQALTGQPGPFPVPPPKTTPDEKLVAAFAEWRTAKGL